MKRKVDIILQETVNKLINTIGEKVLSVVLLGSTAMGEIKQVQDVDVYVVLDEDWLDLDTLEKIKQVLNFIHDEFTDDETFIAIFRKVKVHRVTVNTYPGPTFIMVDGLLYLPTDLPLTFEWAENSTHNISITSNIVYGQPGTRYVFERWNDGSTETSRNITVSRDEALTAIFKTQYHLTVLSPYGEPEGQGWYDADAIVSFKVKPYDRITEGKSRFAFNRWDKGFSPWSPENSIYLSSPLTVSAKWKKQYWLDVSSSVEGIPVSGSGWYDEGEKVTIRTVKMWEVEKNRHKYVFSRWTSLGENFAAIADPESPVTTLVMDNFYSVRAEWVEEWYLKINSSYGEIENEGYYPANSTVKVSVKPIIELDEGRCRVVFTGWEGSINSTKPEVMILMDGFKTLNAKWKKQYFLNIVSEHGGVDGGGWYDEGSTARFSARKVIDGGWGVKYVFVGWSGDTLISSSEGSVVMDEPKTIVAVWRTDYTNLYLNIVVIVGVISAFALVVKKGAMKRIYSHKTVKGK